MESHLANAHSLHPTLALSVAPAVLAHGCRPSVLVHLPAGVFYDPYTASNPIITQGRTKQTHAVQLLHSGDVELEAAAGWTARAASSSHPDEVRREGGTASDGEANLHDILQDVLRDKVREFTTETQPPAGKVRRRTSAKTQKRNREQEDVKKEVSSLVVELEVDELLAADGVKVDIPLHVRYHPPASAKVESGAVRDSPYVGLLNDLLPAHLKQLVKHATSLTANLTPGDTPPSATHPSEKEQKSGYVETTLAQPTLFLSCPSSSASNTYIEGFYSTTLRTLFPASHAHLAQKPNTAVLALSPRKAQQQTTGLTLRVPVPKAELLEPVQTVTMLTVLGAALAVVYHLLAHVVPSLESVEPPL